MWASIASSCDYAGRKRLINSFGLTEATIDSCYYETRS